ncbi:VanW family protein, partial [Patescibacteria group bacterium]|nr:VanW family protein [Patescibacteria group bacterium]
LYSIGRHHFNPVLNFRDTTQILLAKKEIKADIEFAEKDLLDYLKNKLNDFETPAQNASISFENDKTGILSEKTGLKIDYENLLKKLKAQLEALQTPYIKVELVPDIPQIRKYEVEDRAPEIEEILARAPLAVSYNGKEWKLTKEDLKKYLDFERQNDIAVLAISKEKSAQFFEEISKEIDVLSRDAKFNIKDGRVVEFQTSRLGLKVDEEATRAALNSILLNGYPTINAIVETDTPKLTTADTNDFGVSELLGRGESDFKGSPQNRVHNIQTGAKILNGILLKPGEEFSIIKALGEIDDEHGFKKELVIKENRTIKEFGGGLCQIGTTMFRAAIDSGLPILERRPHSYRVGYYEPAGFDATIYNPSPDLKFKNDTPGHILILTKVEGTKLIFDFWGQKDGREVTYTKPVIYNITLPPPVKYINTTELAAGQKKKLESAHNGADAYFEYTVKYNDENKQDIEQTFRSHYRPWAEVWLVGATSTPET